MWNFVQGNRERQTPQTHTQTDCVLGKEASVCIILTAGEGRTGHLMSMGWLFKATKPFTNTHWHSFLWRENLGTQTSEASCRDNGPRCCFGCLGYILMLCSNTIKPKDLENKEDVGGVGCFTQKVLHGPNRVSRLRSEIQQTFPG